MNRLAAPLTLGSHGPEQVADGVWRLKANPGRLNVFFIAEPVGGITQFDAGGQIHLPRIRRCADQLGRLKRVVLSHAHTDHRGAAGRFGVPVWCHRDEVVDVEGTGGLRYWGAGLPRLPPLPRLLHRALLQPAYDGGPAPVAHTVRDGDVIAGFRVVHLPGHAPGLIALFRDFIRRAFSPERQAELAAFARRQGWDMAFEYRAGGGALTSEEVERWREVVEADLNRLIEEAKHIIAGDRHA